MLLERNVLHRVQTCPTGCCLQGGQHVRDSQGGCSPESTQSPALRAAGQTPAWQQWLLESHFSDSCLCTSHLKAASDEATSCPSSTTSSRAGAHGGMRHFPVSMGGDAAAKHGWHIRHPATCTPGAMDSILPRASPGHFYCHLCPVLGSSPAPHRGGVKETPLSSHSTLQPNTTLH